MSNSSQNNNSNRLLNNNANAITPIQIISIKAIREAFLSGIATFTELYNIQNNKNIISQGLGNIALSISHWEKIEIKSIMNSELEGAMKWKNIIANANEEMLIKYLKNEFATKLDTINTYKYFSYSKHYLTSYYSFITLHIYHYALIDDIDEYNATAEKILTMYLTPNTTNETTLTKLYSKVSTALKSIPTEKADKDIDKTKSFNDRKIIKLNKENQLNLDSVSETDRLWAYICKKDVIGAKNFLPNKSIERYQKLADDIKKYGQQEADEYNVEKDQRLINDEMKKTFALTKVSISFVGALLKGLSIYSDTYNRKTSQVVDTRKIVDEAINSSKYS